MSALSELPDQYSALARLPLLADLTPDVRALVQDSFEHVSFRFGGVIVSEGDPADAYWVVLEGRARAVKIGEHGEEVTLNTLGPGDSFGEVSLLSDATRSATVRASSQVEALRLDRSVFAALVRAHPTIRAALERQVRTHRIRDLLRVRSAFAGLPDDALSRLVSGLRPVEVGAGELVVRQGDPAGGMYVVADGRLRVHISQNGAEREVGLLRVGDVFGEVSLFDSSPRTATVQAETDASLLELEPDVFADLLAQQPPFRERVAERVAAYHFRDRARVPPDVSRELLPADATDGAAAVDDGAAAPPLQEAAVEGVVAEPGFSRPARRIRRFPHVWQVDEADCGAACLAMVCRHFGRNVSLARVRDAVRTGTDGTSLRGIARGAEALGLHTATVKASKSRLEELPLPAIVHWDGNHWVVLYDVGPGRVSVADPAKGLRRLRRDEFLEKWSGYAASMAYGEGLQDQPVARANLRWFLQLFHPHRAKLVVALCLALVAAGLEMSIPALGGLIINKVVAHRDLGTLDVIVLAMLGAIALTIAATVIQRYLLASTTVSIDSDALDSLTQRLLALPMSYFQARRTGDIERRLSGLRQVRQFIVQSGVQAITAAAQVVIAVALMVAYNRLLALVYLASIPIYALLMRYSARRVRPVLDTLEESYGRYQSRQIDAIKGIETVKALGAETSLRTLMVNQWRELARGRFRADFTVMVYQGGIQLVTFLSLALFLWIGALEVLAGHLSIGGLVAFNALVVLANGPLLVLLTVWDQLQYSSILLARLNDILEHEPEQGSDHSGLLTLPELGGEIAFHNVSFTYGGGTGAPILEAIDLRIEPGTTVAIVGRSGSGKTSLIKCLAGLLEPTGGTITYDGHDVRALDHRWLRRQIGFVLQENHLFEETIARNIAFGEERPDMERVAWAARLSAAHEFIKRLPLGYETKIGESGLLLSGGQRQRIAIARAVYTRPPVLIFDEATSALDSESERLVQENMDRLFDGRTSIVIAHRLSTVRNADRIVVLDQGRIVEQGTHDELIANEGLYYYLTSQQLGL
jgi:ATP-binding cassette subfamily B protein